MCFSIVIGDVFLHRNGRCQMCFSIVMGDVFLHSNGGCQMCFSVEMGDVFLSAASHFYKRFCPSVGWSVCLWVGNANVRNVQNG